MFPVLIVYMAFCHIMVLWLCCSPSFLYQFSLNSKVRCTLLNSVLYFTLPWDIFCDFIMSLLKISKLRTIIHICSKLYTIKVCSSIKYIFIYAINTAHFLLYDRVFKVTKVYWCFLLMNPLFHHASSAMFLSWILANNEGGAVQVLQYKRETKLKELNIFNRKTELPSKRMFTLKLIIWYVLEVTGGWAVHFAVLCCNYILLRAGKVSQPSASLEQKSACCHFSSLPRCHCQLCFQLGSWMFSISSDSSYHPETNFSYFLFYLLHRIGKRDLCSELSWCL